jgi:hypothetical protein
MTGRLQDAALAVVDRGWPVFVLGRGKRPLANCPQCPKQGAPDAHPAQECQCGRPTCHGFYAATREPSRIAELVAACPDGLLAVRTGAAPDGAGVVGIDIDPRSGGRLVPELMTPTLAVASGNHGWHLYYRHPGGYVASRELPGVAGVDVKADGGYCVLPPSVHPLTRRPYRWANTRPVEEMPPRLNRMVLAPPAATDPARAQIAAHGTWRAGTGAGAGQVVRHPEKLLSACLAAVRQAPEGRRRTTLYGAAHGVARVVLTGHLTADEAVARLVDAGRHAGQTDRDIHAAITGAFTAEGLTHHHLGGVA